MVVGERLLDAVEIVSFPLSTGMGPMYCARRATVAAPFAIQTMPMEISSHHSMLQLDRWK